MQHHYIDELNSPDYWVVGNNSEVVPPQAPKVVLELQANGQQLRVALTPDQAEMLCTELSRQAEDMRHLVSSGAASVCYPAGGSNAQTAGAVFRARERGTHWLQTSTQNGTLVSLPTLADAWGTSVTQLDEAITARRLFVVVLSGTRFVPAVWRDLTKEAVFQVCEAQKGLMATAQLIFWQRKHDHLNGLTAGQAIQGGCLDLVIPFAQRWLCG